MPAESHTLASVGDMSVVFAGAEQIPWTLRELGRLREIAFRAVGEGTGGDSDIDRYDRDYMHLIAWHRTRSEVVGAYRIGHVDRIVAERGKRGLYTHSLFAYGDPFLRSLGPALELGRSFVSAAYQRDFGALLLLWKGIAQYVACNPRYHVLFGPVSISREYRPASHALLIDFLRRHCFDDQLAKLIRPRRAFRRTHSLAALNGDLARLADLDDVSQLLEEDRAGWQGRAGSAAPDICKLGGRLACFNVDESFSGVVDGLIVVDLLRTDRRFCRSTWAVSRPPLSRLRPCDLAAATEPGIESTRQRADVRNAFGVQLLRDQSCRRVVRTIAVDDDFLVDAELQLLDVRDPDAAWNPARAFATVRGACVEDRDLRPSSAATRPAARPRFAPCGCAS